MSQRQNQSLKQEKKTQYSSTNKYTSVLSPKYTTSKIIEKNISPNNKRRNNNMEKEQKILHRSVRRNVDQDGNAIITTKIVREIGTEKGGKSSKGKSMIGSRQNARNISYGLNNEQEDKYIYYSNNGDEENQEYIYDENYEIFSPCSYKSQFKKTQKFSDFREREFEMGNRDRTQGFGGPLNSPIIPNYVRANDNIGKKSVNYNRSNRGYMTSNQNMIERNNYNLESPYALSQSNEFNSPDRQYDYNSKYFRNVQIEKIKGKQPYNQEKMNTRNYLIDTSVENANYPDRDEELFDMIDSMATLIQSNIRGFLVRKKVLRYITLAIYYQSFCDKIQDVLCIHVRNYVFNIFKNKLKNMKIKYGTNMNNSSTNNIYTNNQRKNNEYGNQIHASKSFYKSVKTEGIYGNNNYRIPNNKNNTNKYNTNYIRKEYREYNTNKNTPIKDLRRDYSDIYETRKITNVKKLRKDASYQNNLTSNYNTYHKHKKSEKSHSPSSRVIHYFVNSPCSNKAPHQRYYHEINKKTENVKHFGENQLNNHRTCHKCDEIRRMKKQEKFYITTTTEKREDEGHEGYEGYEQKIYEYENMKYNQSSENIFTHRKDIENDNYLSVNIIRLPGKDDKKSISTRDIFTTTTTDPNKISKVESINIKKTKNQRTEKEIEEEINRRVKITILEKERIEKEKRIKEEEIRKEKERIQREKELEREKERKEKERIQKEKELERERERKEREEKLRKEREEKERIQKEERERERKERERIQKEKEIERERERKEREEKIRKEREEREKKEREKREEQIRIQKEKEKEKKEKQEKERREKQEKERREKEEKLKREKAEREEKLRKEREEKEEKMRKEREEKERKLRKEREEREEKMRKEKAEREEKLRKEREEKRIKEEQIRIEKERQRKIKEEQIRIEKERIRKQQEELAKKKAEEKKINMSDYILKKDCQKNMEDMKTKLTKEYEKKIEMEKKRGLEEQRKYEEKIEIKNRKEIEKIIEQQKRKEIERQREIEKEKENQKKKELELKKQQEKEIKMGIQQEIEKQKEIMKQKELEEKNKKMKLMKVNKVLEVNLKSQFPNSLSAKKIDEKVIEKNKEKALKLIKKYILFRGNHLLKLRKYFNDWRINVKNIELQELSKVIQDFCRNNLELSCFKRVINNWKKLSRKIYYKRRVKILKMRPKVDIKKRKLYELIRITKLNRAFSRRRYIHYMILVWYIYAKNIHRKRVNMKFLYENLLRTYMSLAKDIFGNNQYENPSVQDAMYEAVNTNKFSTSYQDDVPLARKHYAEMRRKKLLEARNKSEYSNNTAKLEIEKKEVRKTYYSKEKIKTEENENDLSLDEQRKRELLNKYRKYKSMNRDLIWKKQHKYIASIEKDYNTEDNEDNNKYDYKSSKINTNVRNNSGEKEKIYTYKKIEVSNYTKPIENKYASNYNKTQGQKNIKIKEYKKVSEASKYSNSSYPSKKNKSENKDISANISANNSKYTGNNNKYITNNINTQKYTTLTSTSNKQNTSMNINVKNYSINNANNNNIKTVPSYDYKKTEIKKTVYTKEEIKPYASKIVTTKTETTNSNNNMIKNSNISIVTSSYVGKNNGNNNNKVSYSSQRNYVNTEGNINNKRNEGKYETKIERKVEIKTGGGSVDKDKQIGKKIFPTKSFQVSRPNH